MIEVKIPRPGESINEVVLSKWFVEDGSFVNKNQELGEIESDKATLPLIAPESGKLAIIIKVGTTIEVGVVACTIDNTAKPEKSKEAAATSVLNLKVDKTVISQNPVQKIEEVKPAHIPTTEVKVTPVAKKMMQDNNLSVNDIIEGLKRIGKEEVEAVINLKNTSGQTDSSKKTSVSRDVMREPMSQLRKKLSRRLVAVKNETAMLTTFNEADMSAVMELRNKYQKKFTEKHNIKLGFMSFFTKAASIALQQFPKVNSMLDGDDIVVPKYIDIGIAVQTEKGLMVPILRNIESMGLAEIEKSLSLLAEKAKSGRLSIEEMSGGTFTITNGGVFGSLFSTPIINPPQAAILGMHNIVERPVAINGKVEIRPMMYLALSYDHRIIDGKDSVSCLFKIKELLESPWKMLVGGENPEKLLLGL